ncbi:hypothetical protein PHISP_06750 [Aspergillus sp. HF37]|nr:hypothetical protein PHISP_06750 [Aspergillus sp. HF37]
MPASSEAPGTSSSHLAHQWLDLYNCGKKIFPGLVVFGSAANAYALWMLHQSPIPAPSTSTYYLIGIAVAMGIAPFTGLAMGKTNNRLKAHAQHDEAAGSEGTKDTTVVSAQDEAKQTMGDEVPELLTHWAKLNLARSVFPLLGAGIMFYAAVSS